MLNGKFGECVCVRAFMLLNLEFHQISHFVRNFSFRNTQLSSYAKQQNTTAPYIPETNQTKNCCEWPVV